MKLNIVPARRGIQWVRLAMQTFLKQPLALAALVFMGGLLGLGLLIVPLIGPFLELALVPIATLGLMAATRVAETGVFPMPSLLFTGFQGGRQRTLSMLLLGALYAASVLLTVLLVTWLVPSPVESKSLAEVVASDEFRTSTLLVTALYMPISLAFWHAPALVFWHGVTPLKSLFFSFVACIRNGRAFLVYSLVWAGIILAIMAATGLAAEVSPWLSGVVFGATMTIAVIVFCISIYFTFRDSFLDA